MARPKVDIDWERVNELLEADCEGTEIAAYLGIVPETLYRRCESDNKISFSKYLQEKKAGGNTTLKEHQYKMATGTEETNVKKSMLIWLGKQRLGQAEKKDLSHTIKDELPFNIKLEYRNRKKDNPQ